MNRRQRRIDSDGFNVLKSAPIDVVDVKSKRVRANMTSGFNFGDGRVLWV